MPVVCRRYVAQISGVTFRRYVQNGVRAYPVSVRFGASALMVFPKPDWLIC